MILILEEVKLYWQVREDEPALKAFRLMRRKGVGGIPVVDDSGRAVGSIMIKDVKHLLTASETNRDYRSGLYMCFIYMATSSISETLLLMRIQNLLNKKN